MIEAKCSVYFALTGSVNLLWRFLNLANHKRWFPRVDKQTHVHSLVRTWKRSRENFLIDLENQSTRNVYPIWREAMSTHLAPFGLKTIPTSAGLALDTLEWSGPALFVSQTSSARRWKASPGLVSSPSTNHRLANPVISDDLWVVFNSLSFSNNFELKSHVVRSTVGELLTWWIRSRTICKLIISVSVCLRRSLNGGIRLVRINWYSHCRWFANCLQ